MQNHQSGKSNIFDDSEDERSQGGSFTIEREEKKNSTSESNEEDAEIVKGDDFTDSDEEDLTIRFSKQILSEDKELPGCLIVNSQNNN